MTKLDSDLSPFIRETERSTNTNVAERFIMSLNPEVFRFSLVVRSLKVLFINKEKVQLIECDSN